MNRILYSLPIIPVYIYGITILTQYGYNSFFDIPQNFIQVSIVQNYIYFFQLFQLAGMIAGVLSWWMWVVVVFGIISTISFYYADYYCMWIARIMGVVLLIYALFHSFAFGQFVAQNTSDFYVMTNNCLSSFDQNRYIIPNLYQDNAILVSVDENNVLKGNMIVKKLSDLECGVTKQNIGLIKKN